MKEMKIGLIGAGFMAKAHAIAYAGMPMFFWLLNRRLSILMSRRQKSLQKNWVLLPMRQTGARWLQTLRLIL